MKQTAIVTGGSRGIGRAVAVRLAKDGMNLVINYRGNSAAAEETERLCRKLGAEVLLVQGDVSRAEDCEKLAAQAKEAFGRVDVLVNNAGITRDGLLARMTEEDFRAVLDVNLVGPWNMMKAVNRIMMKQRYGRIVNLSSVTGLMGNMGQTNYAAAKAGILGMTKSYAREVASRGITVNAVAPGFIDTDMTEAMPEGAKDKIVTGIPMGRTGKPEDVAEAVAFLASEQAGYITGEVLRVDGGMAM
ncbi:3-oxoacyl-[acyl-carrier-protein] reductase [Mogibacterium kristiansenii]|uniref:3-oxoacyl-[acyl-carrier-protein] reductase n=1 Tax=Mogibacterium kristiansenii TaxID=2606708 RepID=A0A6N7XK75_9FIRM|nr:3-oxoacyl-[acyl-carrier-protein] reductase [Mogibacterium kristiansenii]MST70326.1 3-oxoacyl-[acyl-carrier-protein] reductase [Mogibacterium kristiansenii]